MTKSFNPIAKVVQVTQKLPPAVRATLLSKAFGFAVPLVGTAGIRYEEISEEKVVVSIKNRRSVQNHIKSVHAVAVGLIGETATGFVTAMNISGDSMVLVKSMHIEYKKLCKGDLRAVATLDIAQREAIKNNPKGEVTVPVIITDATGQQPVEATFVWAWVPKKR